MNKSSQHYTTIMTDAILFLMMALSLGVAMMVAIMMPETLI